MRPVIVVGVIIFTGICVISNSFGDDLDDVVKKYEPDITLSPMDMNLIRGLDKNSWPELVKRSKDLIKSHAKQVELEQNLNKLELKSCVIHFYCAVINGNNLLEELKKEIEDTLPHQKVVPPDFYESLIEAQRRKGNDDQFASPEDYTTIFQRLYRFVSEHKRTYAKNIYSNLESYLELHPGRYKDITELQTTFCASVVRSSILFNFISHRFFVSMNSAIFDNRHENEFFNYLTNEMPFYYFSKIDVDFLNILLISSNLNNNFHENQLFRYVETNLEIQLHDTVYKNIVIPQSNNCPQQNIKLTTFEIPVKTLVTKIYPPEE